MSLRLPGRSAEPPDRHAGIRGWPWIPDDPKTHKAKQLECAQQLSMQAELCGLPCLAYPGVGRREPTEAEALANITSALQEFLGVPKELNQGRDLREVEV